MVTIDLFLPNLFSFFFFPFSSLFKIEAAQDRSPLQKIVANGKDRFVIGSNKREDRCIDEYDSHLIFYPITRVSRNVAQIDILVCIKILPRFFTFFYQSIISSGIINEKKNIHNNSIE